MADIHQEIIDGFDHTIQEKGNTFVALRKVKWKPDGDEMYDIRKYIVKADGEEQIQKGCSLTEEGLNELTEVLTEEGFGNTRTIMNNIRDREDFPRALVSTLDDGTAGKTMDRLFNEIFKDFDLENGTFKKKSISEDTPEEEFYDIRKELNIE